jgi:hypothetical protein
LSDVERRSQYDKFGADFVDAPSEHGPSFTFEHFNFNFNFGSSSMNSKNQITLRYFGHLCSFLTLTVCSLQSKKVNLVTFHSMVNQPTTALGKCFVRLSCAMVNIISVGVHIKSVNVASACLR